MHRASRRVSNVYERLDGDESVCDRSGVLRSCGAGAYLLRQAQLCSGVCRFFREQLVVFDRGNGAGAHPQVENRDFGRNKMGLERRGAGDFLFFL